MASTHPWTLLTISFCIGGLAGCGGADGSLFGGSGNHGGADAGKHDDASTSSNGGARGSSGGANGANGGTGASGASTGGGGTAGQSSGSGGAALDGGGVDASLDSGRDLDASDSGSDHGSGGAKASGGATATGGKGAGGKATGGAGAGGKGSGGAAEDSGTSPDDATPLSISCGTTDCTITTGITSVCCALPLSFPPFPTGCFPSFPGCVTTGVPFACDDAADCKTGSICCGSTGGTSCAEKCNNSRVQFCRTDVECKTGSCLPWSTAKEYSTCQ